MSGCLHRVDVGLQEKKFPAAFFPRALGRIVAGGILHTVSDDDEKGVLWPILCPGELMNISAMVNGLAHGVQQGRAPSDIVLLFHDGPDSARFHLVMKHLSLIIKESGGNESSTRLFFCFFRNEQLGVGNINI